MIVFDNSIYASGVATEGKSGKKGNTGTDSNSIFYVPLDLRTSDNVIFALNRIKNNQLFSNEVIEKLPNDRIYNKEDLFYSSKGFIYKLNDDFSGFIEIGKVIGEENKITSVRLTSGNLNIGCSDIDNYYYIIYYISDSEFYPITNCLYTSSELTNIPFNGSLSNVLIKYVYKGTGRSEFYKVLND